MRSHPSVAQGHHCHPLSVGAADEAEAAPCWQLSQGHQWNLHFYPNIHSPGVPQGAFSTSWLSLGAELISFTHKNSGLGTSELSADFHCISIPGKVFTTGKGEEGAGGFWPQDFEGFKPKSSQMLRPSFHPFPPLDAL